MFTGIAESTSSTSRQKLFSNWNFLVQSLEIQEHLNEMKVNIFTTYFSLFSTRTKTFLPSESSKGPPDDEGRRKILRRGMSWQSQLSLQKGMLSGFSPICIWNLWSKAVKKLESNSVQCGTQCEDKNTLRTTAGSSWPPGSTSVRVVEQWHRDPKAVGCHLWRSSAVTWTQFWAYCSGWPCYWTGNLQKHLLTLSILQVCDWCVTNTLHYL